MANPQNPPRLNQNQSTAILTIVDSTAPPQAVTDLTPQVLIFPFGAPRGRRLRIRLFNASGTGLRNVFLILEPALRRRGNVANPLASVLPLLNGDGITRVLLPRRSFKIIAPGNGILPHGQLVEVELLFGCGRR